MKRLLTLIAVTLAAAGVCLAGPVWGGVGGGGGGSFSTNVFTGGGVIGTGPVLNVVAPAWVKVIATNGVLYVNPATSLLQYVGPMTNDVSILTTNRTAGSIFKLRVYGATGQTNQYSVTLESFGNMHGSSITNQIATNSWTDIYFECGTNTTLGDSNCVILP